nr:uncharacterized protein LOC109149216 [Ipomoea batatas]
MPQVKNEPNDATTQNVEMLDLVATFHSMHTRAMAKTFVEANKLLTAGQCRTIIGMWFDLMLNLQITDTPLRRLDHVQVGGCTVPRSLPCIVGWDTTLLKEREEWEITSGGFSCGAALEILHLKKKDLRIRVTEKTRIISVGFLELIELLHEVEMTTDKTDRHC